ncbi:alpha/beta-hydrolase [Conidiobolus coronatus NRRL 28638]|uniref:Alpha/beta-hydrolase n=1 Tax=Conidiobolus coronatus (strain ATCC 28846 / CBS 209.66 / NRRL 28638) TaxID=796925 RepID=A0A137PH12_CONC2|nr:alpha/beta-hydrolase [Conidiobolus coronatus NRRL 28638]|eukprot:KXN74293.1 alpha/beta-hydrolase [Conidiobolus coronatus NRRL 28638]
MSARSMLDSEYNFKGWLAMDTERMNTPDLNRNHVLDWIGWAVFGKSAIELEKEEIEEAEEYIVEAGLEKYLEVAPSKNQKTIRMFNQLPVPFQYIPLSAYIIVHLVKSLGGFILRFMGFIHSSVSGVNNISYWIRQNNKSKEPPIIFCHGVGIGPVMYTLFIHKLTKLHPDRTIVVLQLDYLSMGLVEKPVSRALHLAFFDSIFQKHKFTQADWICHSFGSFVMSTVASQRPHLVKNLTFIDPVCFNLLDPFLVYQVYSGPLTSISFQYILRYLVAYEFSVVRFFLRNFWWEEMVFFPDYLKNIKGQVKVYLSEDDLIVDHKTTTNFFNTYFNHDNFNYYTIESAPHGGCIWNFSLMDNLLNNLNY